MTEAAAVPSALAFQDTVEDEIIDVPVAAIPRAPAAAVMWRRAVLVGWIVLAWLAFDRLTLVLLDYWIFEDLGFESVFWTNFRMRLGIWIVSGALFFAAVFVPVVAHRVVGPTRRTMLSLSIMVGLVAGWIFSAQYVNFFGFFQGKPFGQDDPVFHHDIGFYVFDLPVLKDVADGLVVVSLLGLVVSAVLAYRTRVRTGPRRDLSRPARFAGILFTPCTRVFLVLLGLSSALELFLTRYGLLYRSNPGATVFNGPQVLDIDGFFSRVNLITLEIIVLLAGITMLTVRLTRLHRAVRAEPSDQGRLNLRNVLIVVLPGILITAAFSGLMGFRNTTDIVPNQPVIQYEAIQRHIDATREAYALNDIETKEFRPASGDDPKPTVEELLNSPTLKNAAPLWPGYVSWIERIVDAQHADRILLTEGDTMIYGPAMETFSQQQKLRAYYDFLDIDTVKYDVGGEPRLFASAVREVPLEEPKPWLAYWGQRFMLFTHGHGLVMAPLNEVSADGSPVYATSGLPVQASDPALEMDQPAVYYGEGAASMAYTNVKDLQELDLPTDQGRLEVAYEGDGGVELDSFLKRVVFGYRSGQLFQIAFSDLIGDDSKVHYYRTPQERVQRLAPFLHFDADAYGVNAQDRVTWMVNGMSHTDRYPYSRIEELGDKADRRSPIMPKTVMVNYVRDSVKATIDAYTGDVTFYKWMDEPVIDTWQSIYPDLFTDADEMPDDVRAQVQYPVQLFHLQFDDMYIYYHMDTPVEFFNLEDAWDDGDDVKGPVIDTGDSITFSIEPYHWLATTGGAMAESSEDTQFVLSMPFTNENALNLRALTNAYMTGEDYGKLSVLQVPKGVFYPGPEQADAAIDQDAFIAQQIGFWNRQGLEAIRGHTTPLVIGNEVIYIEPIFTRSKQNRLPQLQRVVVVFRGKPFMGRDLEEALRFAIEGPPQTEIGQPLFPLDT
jgi:uncharacterized protein